MTQSRFTDQHVPSMTGKVALVTGGNTGLGFEAAKVLARQGAEVIIACRSVDKAGAAIDLIRSDNPQANISSIQLDLGNLESVRSVTRQMERRPSLNLLINNAGIMTPPYELTANGFESQFGVNHLGPFALTGLLLDKLQQAPGARVVNTSSLAGRKGRILFDDVNAEHGYDAMERYSMSKLANLIFSLELDRRLRLAGISCLSVACHPGIADTELSRYFPGWFKAVSPLVKYLFNTPAQGAWPTLMAATHPDTSGGEYYGPSRRAETSGPAVKVSTPEVDSTVATKLWDISMEMTGVHYLSDD